VENAIRPTAIGKKNWLFFGDAEAEQRNAVIYTIIESCRRRGIDPHEYLRDVLTRITESTNWQVAELTPENWAKTKAALKKRRRCCKGRGIRLRHLHQPLKKQRGAPCNAYE
jgi:hypothetical protein